MPFEALSEISNFFNSNTDNDSIRVGDPNAVEKFYQKLKENGYNLDELKDILECDDNLLIVSAAGSGKTTTLLFKIIHDILSGKLIKQVMVNGEPFYKVREILVSTFLRTGALELAKDFDKYCKEFGIMGVASKDISFRTIHSEVFSAISNMGITVNIGDESLLGELLRAVAKELKIHSVMSKGNSKILTTDELSDISCLMTYARNRLDKERYNHPLMKEYNLDELTLKALIEYYKSACKLHNISDFEALEEMLYEAYKLNPHVLEFIKSRYEYIYVDEFQDTSQLQYEILRPYFSSAKGIMCIGDEDQCIYSWRGSDINLIMNTFKADYNPVVKKLSVNRRCAENILNSVIPSIEKNTKRYKKNFSAVNKGGELEIIVDGGVNYLTNAIKEDLKTSNQIGILGRTNADLLIPALLLSVEGYNSFSISKAISLRDRIPSQVLGVIRLITQRYNNDFEGYFKLFLNKYNSYQATKLCDILSTTPEYSIYTLPLEDIKYSAPNLFYIIRMLRNEVPRNPVGAYLSLLDILETDVYSSKTIYAQRARDFIYYIKKIITEHSLIKNMTIDELDNLFLTKLPDLIDSKKPAKATRKKNAMGKWYTEEPPKDDAYIKITTVHEAKGKQWDYVYIWNDVNGCFPNSVGNRELTEDEFEEERRVHYIAWTRAKKKLVVFTRSDIKGGFLEECDLENAKIKDLSGIKNRELKLGLSKEEKVIDNKTSYFEIKDKTWQECVEEYFKKYTSYSYICSVEGENLDKCLMRLNGLDGLINYLETFNLSKYPQGELEGVISDILSDYVAKQVI